MKSLLKIIRRYSLTTAFIIVLILSCNLFLFFWIGYSNMEQEPYKMNVRTAMERVMTSLKEEDGEYCLSPKAQEVLERTDFIWAMALSPEGKVVWDWRLPEELQRTYSLADVASFSRWYLEDYPVRVWRDGEFLGVFGYGKGEVVTFSMKYDGEVIRRIPFYIRVFLIANVIVILGFVLILGYRFYCALRPVSQGIGALSNKEVVYLQEKGAISELAAQINRTSRILEEQEQKLARRDQARAEWISGVSHDIRTPLTLIMGYSERLAADVNLGEQERNTAFFVKRQAETIRQLIEDLNLTSKLSYNSAPLHMEDCAPAQLLRECVADVYNGGLNQEFEIDVYISEAAEQCRIQGDEKLLKRALRNILGNSIRHNPGGCIISASLDTNGEFVVYSLKDSGSGIPKEIVGYLQREDDGDFAGEAPHIMGLRLAWQIARAHGGQLHFVQRENGNYDCDIELS